MNNAINQSFRSLPWAVVKGKLKRFNNHYAGHITVEPWHNSIIIMYLKYTTYEDFHALVHLYVIYENV